MSDAAIAVIISAGISIIGIIISKYFSQPKDRSEYGQNLLKIANDATNALELSNSKHEKEIEELKALYEKRISDLEAKIIKLEAVQQRYTITLELVSNGKPRLVSHSIEETENAKK